MKRCPGIETIYASTAEAVMYDETGFDSVQSHLFSTFPCFDEVLLSVPND
jgi:hypothetical protein